jgi:hypothetical protein
MTISTANLRIGVASGLIAVLVTSALNIVGRALGLLPEQLDLKRMAFFVIEPTAAFWIGLALHLVGGMIAGAIFAVLIKQPTPLKGIAFSLVAVWLGMVLVVFPLAGFGIFGLNVGAVMSIGTLILNILYGGILGLLTERFEKLQPSWS